MKKTVVILGSTGSIGTQALGVMRLNQDKFQILALAGGKNVHLLIQQVLEFKPKFVLMEDSMLLAAVQTKTSHLGIKFLSGKNCYQNLAQEIERIDCLISAISGIACLLPTLTLMPKISRLAIANKESIICGGTFFMQEVVKNGVTLIPVDSEHNSLYQIINGVGIGGEGCTHIAKLILTASGGPFFGKNIDSKNITIQDALKHPNWSMGGKITIDSATMANKALELMEAVNLFKVHYKKVDAIIHTKSIVHAIVQMQNGGMHAFLSNPDMKLHIANAICDDESSINNGVKKLDLCQIASLDFHEIPKSFPIFYLGKYALKQGIRDMIIFNASNEIAVSKFLKNEINFNAIYEIIESTLSKNINAKISSIDDAINLDSQIRTLLS